MFKSYNRKAQSTLEYAVLIVLVAVALIATQTYVKRAMQGRLRSAADDMGEQFSPGASNVFTTTNSYSATRETMIDRQTNSALTAQEYTNRTVNMDIEGTASDNEGWGRCGDGDCKLEEGETKTTCALDCG